MTKTVALGMSGGVDSSTSALLLRNQGYDVTGFFFAGLNPGPGAEAAVRDVRRVAAQLGIRIEILDLSTPAALLRDYFLSTYQAGQTPNVCVQCNARVKFGFFADYARAHRYDFVATGHYVRLRELNGETYLQTAADESKDQSYFLGLVPEDVWSRVLFPLGDYHKTQVRQLAREHGLPVADKPESMEICFIQGRPTREYLREHLPQTPGEIVDESGRVIGYHQGLAFYTLGQRQGLDIPPVSPDSPAYYVLAKDPAANRLIVGPRARLEQTTITIREPTPRLCHELAQTTDFTDWRVRIRHQGTLYPVASIMVDEEAKSGKIVLATPAWAISPGQFAVCYRQDPDDQSRWIVVGGGVIS